MGIVSKSKMHIAATEESYFQHQFFAFRFAWKCFQAGFMAIVHGFVPAFFETGASRQVKKLFRCLEENDRSLL